MDSAQREHVARQLVDAGYTTESANEALAVGNLGPLVHMSGYQVRLLPPDKSGSGP